MRREAAWLLAVLLLGTASFAAKAPDIPTGSKLYLENKSTSDESQLFTQLFREKLTKDESKGIYSKPGFPTVDKKEDAAYVLRFLFVLRENQKSFGEGPQEHARVNVWLLDSRGTVIWEHNYDCERVFREPARECYQHISDDLKAAQVNADGKRAGWLGWRLAAANRAPASRNVLQSHESAEESTTSRETPPPQMAANRAPASRNVLQSQGSAEESLPAHEARPPLVVAQGTIGASSGDNPVVRHDGITLSSVVAGGPADQAGMKAGDVVLAIDGHYLYTGQEMNDETLRHKPGTKITIRYRRYTATYEASVVMGTAQQPTPIATPTAPSPTHPVAAVAGFGQGQDKPSESAPPSDGVFYKTQTGWQQLEVLTSAGQNIHVNMLTMHGGGDQLYRGAEAPIQVSDRRPVFYIKVTPAEALMAEAGGPNAARNAVIVILSKKKDHRELRSVKTGLAGVKSGIDKRLLPDITVHSINNLMFTITPNQDLAPGEYLLTWKVLGTDGYDFGIK